MEAVCGEQKSISFTWICITHNTLYDVCRYLAMYVGVIKLAYIRYSFAHYNTQRHYTIKLPMQYTLIFE